MQISGVLICSVFGSLFGGIWLDRRFGTTPCLMFLLMMVGIAFAMYTIIGIAKEQKHKNSGNDQ